jgi:hypothetical protein
MEPTQNPNVQPNPGQQPVNPNLPTPSTGETQPAPVAPEAAPQPGTTPNPAAAMPPPVVPVDPAQAAAQAPAPQPGANPNPAAAPAMPAVAADVDVIEKEWVDKANDTINKTKDDPYREEEEVEALQIDYLKKRYGHEVKKPGGK